MGEVPCVDGDNQIMAVVGDVAAEQHFFIVRTLVDKFIFGLRGAEPVIVELLEIIGLAHGRAGGLVVPAVEESFVVFGPGSAGELYPFKVVREIFAGVDVAHVPLVPVGAGSGNAVGHELAVVGYGGVG